MCNRDGREPSGGRASTVTIAVAPTTSTAPTPVPPTTPPTQRATTASSAQPVSTIAPPSAAIDGHLTLAFTGDALWHSPLWRQAERNSAATGRGAAGMDFTPMLAPLRPLLGLADVAVCHLETPIAPDGERYTTFPLYGVPPGVVDALAGAGFDRCSTASNHTIDRGVAGIDRTVSVLESHGLGQSGMARTPEEIAPRVFVADGFRVVHLSYTFGTTVCASRPDRSGGRR